MKNMAADPRSWRDLRNVGIWGYSSAVVQKRTKSAGEDTVIIPAPAPALSWSKTCDFSTKKSDLLWAKKTTLPGVF